MYSKHSRFQTAFGLVAAFLTFVSGASLTLAGAPQLDNGATIPTDNPYSAAQPISNVFDAKAIYGKLEGSTPIDIYSLKPDKDGEQAISLLYKDEKKQGAQPLLIFVDPTDATEAQQLNLPLPGDAYHAAVLKPLDTTKSYREAALFQQFTVISEDTVKLKKDTTYYLVVLDPYRIASHYAIKFGTGPAWTAKDVLKNFGAWFRLQTDRFGASTPFSFVATTFGFLLFLLGLIVLVGIWLIEEIFAWQANRNKAAGYVLIKLQPFSRIIIWVALWFLAMGGYIYFDKVGWVGIPFVLALLFIPILAVMLFKTFSLNPRLTQLEVTKREATIPSDLRKRWFFSSLVSLFSLGAFVTYLSMYLTNR